MGYHQGSHKSYCNMIKSKKVMTLLLALPTTSTTTTEYTNCRVQAWKQPRFSIRYRRRSTNILPKLMVVVTIFVAISSFTVLCTTTHKDTPTTISEKHDVVVVATIQGEWIGLHHKTGDVLWRHSSSNNSKGDSSNGWAEDEWNRLFAPLLSTSSTTKPKLPSKTVAVPSVDGRVFLTPPPTSSDSTTTGGGGGTTDLKSILSGTSIRSLVTKSPFMDSRGRFYVGSRRSTVAAIDCHTGELLRVIKGEQQQQHDGEEESHTNNNLPQTLEGRNVIWIARVDHSITIYNARTGNVDVTFSSSEILSLSDMIGNYMLFSSEGEDDEQHEDEGDEGREQQPHLLEATSAELTSHPDEDIYLLSTPGGKLAMLKPSSGDTNTVTTTNDSRISWIAHHGRSFSSAVAFAVSSETGTSLKVDIVPDAPMATDSVDYLAERFEKQLESILQQQHDFDIRGAPSKEEEEGTIIVGAFPSTHQLFALPLGRRSITTTTKESSRSSTSSTTTTASSSTTHKTILSGRIPNKQHLLHETTTKLLPSNMKHPHHYTSSSSSSSSSIAATSSNNVVTGNHKALICAKKCMPTSPTYPACLIGFRNNIIPLPHYYSSDEENPIDILNEDDINNYYNIRNFYWIEILFGGNKYQNPSILYRISWIVYLMIAFTILFALSFQLGRREQRRRQCRQAETEMTTNTAEKVSIQNNGAHVATRDDHKEGEVLLRPASSDEIVAEGRVDPQSQQQHLISVSNEILGYGGHGTVVYQGTLLDGRKVAVKRMLKTYNASADREISLLIESDGHPNVVRYFLKEVRGDFIYLALELCDLSLADLIYAIGRRGTAAGAKSSTSTEGLSSEAAWLTAVKNTLYQIASGVRHLHSLRIVHRDLKPQNILLALRHRNSSSSNGERNYIQRQDWVGDEESWRASLYEAFKKNDLVPKISDMGLGKQLVTGQSSFGASSIARSSALNGENASLIGPGSVGWTAPEVMALRTSRDPLGSFCDQTSTEVSPEEESPIPSSKVTSRSVDIFSLGCIFYCTLLPGLHPFGEWYEREANIMRGSPRTHALEEVSAEASALVNSMISRDPRERPTADEICRHPFFWKPSKRLSFLSDFSDRVELQSDNLELNLLVVRVETNAAAVIGLSWDKALDADLISNVSRFRTYDPSSVRDCLRMIRNKYHHFCELPDSVKDKIGYSLDDLLHYFESKFPLLLMHCYNLSRDVLPKNDALAVKYGICSHLTAMKPAVDKEVGEANGGSEVGGAEGCKVPTLQDEKAGSVLEECVFKLEKIEADDAADVSGGSEDASLCKPPICLASEESGSSLELQTNHFSYESIPVDIVIWEGSSTARLLNCRGWMRSEEDWRRRTDALLRKRDINVTRCVEDAKFRTRLCNHWDISKGTYCSMRKKNKCIFAHGPVELRVKEGKRHRWGTLVDELGDNNNPFHSGGEDTYGTARSIESKRKEDGQWVADKIRTQKSSQKPKGKVKEKEKGKRSS